MAVKRVSPSSLSKHKACPSWAASTISMIQKPNSEFNLQVQTSEKSKNDPRWIGSFLHRIMQYSIESTGGNSFQEASQRVRELQKLHWDDFILEIQNL